MLWVPQDQVNCGLTPTCPRQGCLAVQEPLWAMHCVLAMPQPLQQWQCQSLCHWGNLENALWYLGKCIFNFLPNQKMEFKGFLLKQGLKSSVCLQGLLLLGGSTDFLVLPSSVFLHRGFLLFFTCLHLPHSSSFAPLHMCPASSS